VVRDSKVRKNPNLKKKPEPEMQVRLRLSVAKDLIVVLSKFSNHKMDLLRPGEKDHADRLLALNLFRVRVEEELRKHDN
jgi:hypothetical protein